MANIKIDYVNSYIKEIETSKFKYDIELQKERVKIYGLIKEDLEVLEILINKSVDVGRFKAKCYLLSTPDSIMRNYNFDCNYVVNELLIDEVIILKKYFESNKK